MILRDILTDQQPKRNSVFKKSVIVLLVFELRDSKDSLPLPLPPCELRIFVKKKKRDRRKIKEIKEIVSTVEF